MSYVLSYVVLSTLDNPTTLDNNRTDYIDIASSKKLRVWPIIISRILAPLGGRLPCWRALWYFIMRENVEVYEVKVDGL